MTLTDACAGDYTLSGETAARTGSEQSATWVNGGRARLRCDWGGPPTPHPVTSFDLDRPRMLVYLIDVLAIVAAYGHADLDGGPGDGVSALARAAVVLAVAGTLRAAP